MATTISVDRSSYMNSETGSGAPVFGLAGAIAALNMGGLVS